MYWVIGNEPDIHNETAATYSSEFNTLYDAMKAVDSSIKIGGGPTAWCDSSFLTTFVEDRGSRVDFLDLHFYPGNDTESQLLAAPEALSTDLSDARTLINTYVPGGASSIAIRVGEYNLSWVDRRVRLHRRRLGGGRRHPGPHPGSRRRRPGLGH